MRSLAGRIGAVLALAGLLASCGAGDDGPDASPFTITENPDVASLLGTPLTESDVEAERNAVVERSEALTATCMGAAGFDYIPVPPALDTSSPVAADSSSFGVADQFFAVYDDDFEPPAENPNLEVLETLSNDELTAYNVALNGAVADFDPRFDSLETLEDVARDDAESRSGCRAESLATAVAETDRNPVLIDDYQRLRIGMINTDQRMIRARVDWATCMAEAGFPYNNAAAIFEDLSREAAQVLAELQDRGIELVPGETPSAEATALIDGVYEREAAAAEAEADCGESLDRALDEVSADVDTIFLDRNS